MKPPIIVVEHGDVNIFKSPDDAQMYLEPVDIENYEYQIYDNEGRLLNPKMIIVERPSLLGTIKTKSVKLVEADEKTDHSDELKNIIINFFKNTSFYEPGDEKLPLDKLIAKAVDAFGYTS